jgi:hypothetical protein
MQSHYNIKEEPKAICLLISVKHMEPSWNSLPNTPTNIHLWTIYHFPLTYEKPIPY